MITPSGMPGRSSNSTFETSPILIPLRRTGMPSATPGASRKWALRKTWSRRIVGDSPNQTIIMIRTRPATMTNMPIRNCMTRSFMAGPCGKRKAECERQKSRVR